MPAPQNENTAEGNSAVLNLCLGVALRELPALEARAKPKTKRDVTSNWYPISARASSLGAHQCRDNRNSG